jgi:hypothetical protein
MQKSYALYLSYNRWLHELPLAVDEICQVSEALGVDPSELEEAWESGCFPQDGEIFDPSNP